MQIIASGVWTATSDLRRTLATSTSTTTFTFATWYKSSWMGAMVLNAGVTAQRHTFAWNSQNDGRIGFQHQVDAAQYAAFPPLTTAWPYLGMWVHVQIAVDTTQPALGDRVRIWFDGVAQILDNTGALDLLQDQALYLGDTVMHAFGRKWDGAFSWTGALAETYVIWGHALAPDSFIELTTVGLRSMVYAGPVTSESVYFDYQTPGENRFFGQPDWTAAGITSNTTDLPY
ncbi:MAG: hypothetical protein ACKV2T_00345 [Kofleriaceae bacterium]